MNFYIKLQCFLTLFLLCFINLGYNAKIQRLYEGDVCRKNNGKNSNYICQNLENCPVAIKEIEEDIYPQICSFNGKTAIVCCPPEKNTTTTINPVLTYSATEKCREYSELIYFKIPDPILTTSSKGNYITKTDCYIASPLISNGEDAEPKEFPHMALLGYGEKPHRSQWSCGGSLISKRFVLTAAHCEKFGRIGAWIYAKWARFGELDYSLENDDAKPTDYKIVQHIIHPNYIPPSLYHDIALFQLERDVDFSAYVRPICLNTDNILRPPAITATGWGQTASNKGFSSHLLKVKLNTISTKECDNVFKYMPNKNNKLPKGIDENSMLCTGRTVGKDTCGGDSGGPIQIKHNSYKCMYSQIGITSFGKNICGQQDSPACYTRVSNYISWIERIVWPKM